MTGCLVDILKGADQFSDMLVLVLGYVTAIAIVQTARYIKRFYVRRFANNVNRRMKKSCMPVWCGKVVQAFGKRGREAL